MIATDVWFLRTDFELPAIQQLYIRLRIRDYDMSNYKIIFTGPVGAGKTTAIATLSDIPLFSTAEVASEVSSGRKAETTVALDYGVMKLDGGDRLHLFGTPGQERFDFMWNILTGGGVGLVLLINNSAVDPFLDLHFFLDTFDRFIDKVRVVIGITHMDVDQYPTIADYRVQLEASKHNILIFEVDAREYQDMVLLIEAILYTQV